MSGYDDWKCTEPDEPIYGVLCETCRREYVTFPETDVECFDCRLMARERAEREARQRQMREVSHVA